MKKIILFIAIGFGVALQAEAQTRVVVRTPVRRVVVVPGRRVVVVRPAVPVVARRVVVRRRVL